MRRYKPLAGYVFTGCAVRSNGAIALCAHQPAKYSDVLVPFLHALFFYQPYKPAAQRWAVRSGFAATGVRVCGTEAQWVAVFEDGFVFAVGGGAEGKERKLPTYVTNVRLIGKRAYATCLAGDVYRRDRPNAWTRLRIAGKPALNDIAGFSERDLYACGDGGAWRHDGKSWTKLPIPALGYNNACCTDDTVYLSSFADGCVFAGRDRTWRRIDVKLKHLAWYRDRLYATTQQGTIRELRDDKLVAPKFASPIEFAANLAVGNGMLVASGGRSAAMFDGKRWTRFA